jgi:hypothetical protein
MTRRYWKLLADFARLGRGSRTCSSVKSRAPGFKPGGRASDNWPNVPVEAIDLVARHCRDSFCADRDRDPDQLAVDRGQLGQPSGVCRYHARVRARKRAALDRAAARLPGRASSTGDRPSSVRSRGELRHRGAVDRPDPARVRVGAHSRTHAWTRGAPGPARHPGDTWPTRFLRPVRGDWPAWSDRPRHPRSCGARRTPWCQGSSRIARSQRQGRQGGQGRR